MHLTLSSFQKLLTVRCIFCSFALISTSVFWAYLTAIVYHPDPASYNLELVTLIKLHPEWVASTAITLVILYWVVELFLARSKSIARFALTLLITLVTPFALILLFIKFSNHSPAERDITVIQKARFGEYGTFLESAESITLYSINPTHLDKKEQHSKDELFHHFEVLGKLDINSEDTIREIHRDLQSRINSTRDQSYAYCFDPRHGIRAFRGNQFIDYLICFDCHHLYLFRTIDGEHERIELEGPRVNQLLNDIIDRAGLKRDKPSAEKH